MIVDPDFPDHWRTRMLVGMLGDDELAPIYLLRLWGHCQNRKSYRFTLPTIALRAICHYPGDAHALESALIESGFLRRDGSDVEVVGWQEYNAKLVANWENGGKGGRPPKDDRESACPGSTKPNGNPTETQPEPNTNPPGTDKRREEKKEEKALSGKPDGADRESACPDSVAIDVLEYLNAKAGKAFKPVRANLSLIQARLRESACPDELKAVIDAKVAQWRDDPKMGQYLRPETLFNAQKFASYIGQLERKPRADWWLKHGFGSEREALEAGVSDGVTA